MFLLILVRPPVFEREDIDTILQEGTLRRDSGSSPTMDEVPLST